MSDYLITRNRLWFEINMQILELNLPYLGEAVRFLFIGRPAQNKSC